MWMLRWKGEEPRGGEGENKRVEHQVMKVMFVRVCAHVCEHLNG